jgi:hypothetical protein
VELSKNRQEDISPAERKALKRILAEVDSILGAERRAREGGKNG